MMSKFGKKNVNGTLNLESFKTFLDLETKETKYKYSSEE
jgi:hypothetical protein